MKKAVIGINQQYFKLIPIIPIAAIMASFLPYIIIREFDVSVSGWGVLSNAIHISDQTGNYSYLLLAVFLIAVPLLLVAVTHLFAYINPGKKSLRMAVAASAVHAFCAVAELFTIATTIDKAGVIGTKFLIKYCSAGFWFNLLIAFVGLVIVMKAAKINPGYIVLVVMSVIWLFPIVWIIMISFRLEPGSYTSYFWPKALTLDNYKTLLTDSSTYPFKRWFYNTLFVAVCSCVLTSFIVLSTAFVLSRIRFSGRKAFMNILLILGMFPGFMSMIAVYYILKGIGFTQSLTSLILVYSGSGAMSYYIAKGFFDTIPKALDEAAWIDGATKWQLFTKITLPLSKPILIYSVLVAFISPWGDYIFAKIIMGDNYQNYTVALGLFLMLDKANINLWYTKFAAGAVLISVPISILFIALQKYYVEGLSGSVKG